MRSTTPGEIFWDERAERQARKERRRLFAPKAIAEMDENELADLHELHTGERPASERAREEQPREERTREERPQRRRPPRWARS